MDEAAFDIYMFKELEDYNCYIEQSTLYVQHGEASMCNFLENSSSTVIKEQVTEWSNEDSDFLNKENQISDILVVIDNTNYLGPFSNRIRAEEPRDVVYDLEIKTTFSSNDLYEMVMMGFIISFGLMFALILLNCCLYRLQRRSFN